MGTHYIDLLQWGGTIGILTGLFLMEKKVLSAPAFLCVGAVLMCLFGLVIEAYGVAVTNLGAALLSLRALWAWRKSS
jgi:hypothetical protein